MVQSGRSLGFLLETAQAVGIFGKAWVAEP